MFSRRAATLVERHWQSMGIVGGRGRVAPGAVLAFKGVDKKELKGLKKEPLQQRAQTALDLPLNEPPPAMPTLPKPPAIATAPAVGAVDTDASGGARAAPAPAAAPRGGGEAASSGATADIDDESNGSADEESGEDDF